VTSVGWLNQEIESLPLVDRIRAVLAEKVKHYGPVGQPFVIVFGLDSLFDVGEDEIMDALLGRRQCTFVRKADGSHEAQWSRDVDGFWGYSGKPKNTRLSGVLFVGNWTMNTLAANFISSDPWPVGWASYVTNPFAAQPVLDPFPALPRILLNAVGNDSIAFDRRPGQNFATFLFER
jgi:hypothetical protein